MPIPMQDALRKSFYPMRNRTRRVGVFVLVVVLAVSVWYCLTSTESLAPRPVSTHELPFPIVSLTADRYSNSILVKTSYSEHGPVFGRVSQDIYLVKPLVKPALLLRFPSKDVSACGFYSMGRATVFGVDISPETSGVYQMPLDQDVPYQYVLGPRAGCFPRGAKTSAVLAGIQDPQFDYVFGGWIKVWRHLGRNEPVSPAEIPVDTAPVQVDWIDEPEECLFLTRGGNLHHWKLSATKATLLKSGDQDDADFIFGFDHSLQHRRIVFHTGTACSVLDLDTRKVLYTRPAKAGANILLCRQLPLRASDWESTSEQIVRCLTVVGGSQPYCEIWRWDGATASLLKEISLPDISAAELFSDSRHLVVVRGQTLLTYDLDY